jgi:two-component system repressor protein LuxO
MPETPGKYALIIEDMPDLAEVCAASLERGGFRTRMFGTGSEGLDALKEGFPDAVLLDLGLPDMEGMDVLKRLREATPDCAVIIITGQTSLDTVVEAMRAGADDFVAKPFDPARLRVSVENAVEKRRLARLVHTYESVTRESFCGIAGKSPEMQAAYRVIESAARTSAPALITGESGTGKELAAQAIHSLSARRGKPIVTLNCAAIPHGLLESEIFGHVKGAFTGALSSRAGAAKQADGGTLFLDELGEMPMELQAKLLRLAQSGAYTPVGGEGEQRADIRFICATNRDPLEAVRQGRLREDLYYRLNVVALSLPPLRERGEDVIMLAEIFLEKFARQEKKKFAGLSDDAKALLRRHSWPGNVRELENAIRGAVVLHDGERLAASMLKLAERWSPPAQPQEAVRHAPSSEDVPLPAAATDIRPLEEIEFLFISRAVRACQGNISEAARRLSISPSTIHRRLKERG